LLIYTVFTLFGESHVLKPNTSHASAQLASRHRFAQICQ
jgi:hypothetical protein